jgi:hypothetical protein
MIRPLLLVFVVLCAAFGLGQKAKSIFGKWVIEPQMATDRMWKDVSLTFRKDGTLAMTGFNAKGEGVYKVSGNKIEVTLTKRNGVKPGPHESSTTVEIAENGNALLIDGGQRVDGKKSPIRLVRAK